MNTAPYLDPSRPRSKPLDRLLLKLSSRAPEPSLSSQELAILTDPALQEDFFSLAGRHGVQGLVISALADASLGALPPTLAHRVRRLLRLVSTEAALWDLERDRLLSHLHQHGLIPVLLKGAALRHTVYSASAQRPIGDIDLLLPPNQIADALEALSELGYENPWPEVALNRYRQHHFHVRLTNSNDFTVEVHWGLTRPNDPMRLDASTFLRRSVLCRRPAGPSFLAPSTEDMILHLACQNAVEFFRLGRLADIDRAVATSTDLDWDYLESSARKGNLGVALAVSLQLCESLFATSLPRGLVHRLCASRAARWHFAIMRPVRWPLSRTTERFAAIHVRHFWFLPGWRLQLSLIRKLLAGRKDPLRWTLDDGPAPSVDQIAPLSGVASVIKIAVYQLWLYCRAAASSVSSGGRRQLHFWSEARELTCRAEVRESKGAGDTTRKSALVH